MLLIGTVVAAILFVRYEALPYLISLTPARMVDELVQKATSPDRRYVAKLYYNDGLTFGYGHITLETSGWHPLGHGRTELVEVAAEGLSGVTWRDNHTLIVQYDAGKEQDGDAVTQFVSQPKSWRDVRVVYQPVK